MSQKQQYEEILSYYFINDYSVTPEMHNASIELRQEMSGSIDGLRWFIDSMPFELITTYQAAFECFKFQLFNNSENIPPDILSALYQLLFVNSIQMMQFNNFPPEVISELANAQMYLSLLILDKLPNDIFNFVFQFPDILKFKFLSSFCHALILPTPSNINNIRSIKGLLNQTNLIQQILAIIQEGVFKSNPDAIFALGFMTRWISDISFLQNEDLLIRIFSYNSSEFVPAINNFMASIVQRSMPDELKYGIIQKYQFIIKIKEFYHSYQSSEEILKSCAMTLCTLDFSLKSDEFKNLIFEMATFFLMNNNDEVSECVISYFQNLVRSDPSTASIISHNVVQKLINIFSSNIVFKLSPHMMQLLSVINYCFWSNSNVTLQTYYITAGNINLIINDVPRLSTFLLLSLHFLQNKKPIPNFEQYNAINRELFKFQPPVQFDMIFPILTSLRSFLFRNETDAFAQSYRKEIFTQLKQFSTYIDLPEDVRQMFSKVLFEYTFKKPTKFVVSENDIFELMFYKMSNLMSTASLLLQSFISPKQQVVSQQCIWILKDIFKQNKTKETLTLILSFFIFFENSDENIEKEVYDFLLEILNDCEKDDYLLSLLCAASYKMQNLGLSFFVQNVFPHVNNINSIINAAETTMNFINRYQNNEQLMPQIYTFSANFVGVFINSMTNILSHPLKSYNIQIVINMIMKCYALFTRCFEAFSQFPDVQRDIILFTRSLIGKRYDDPNVLKYVFRFLEDACKTNPQFFATHFTQPSLYFLLAPGYDPHKKSWSLMLIPLIAFHSNLQNGAYAQFSGLIRNFFDEFGLASEYTQNYLISLEKDQRDAQASIKNIFIDILAARNSNTWE